MKGAKIQVVKMHGGLAELVKAYAVAHAWPTVPSGWRGPTSWTPGAIEEFVDLVVPELQRRGRYRRDYAGTQPSAIT